MIDRSKFICIEASWVWKEADLSFLNMPISIHVDTTIDSDQAEREIFEEQWKTLDIIDQDWQEVAPLIEQEILNYSQLPQSELERVMVRPTIWLGMDSNKDEPWHNHKWSFVLGVSENEDFGWHVEFEGISHVDTWAGG
ncbi:MAG: hypothetical protein AAFY71_02930 [Bacteroidota bacterium]